MKAFLDTHAAIALYEGEIELFGTASIELVERSALFVSPIVRLELSFLHEIERIRIDAEELLGTLEREVGVSRSEDPLAAVVHEAIRLTWTRDPFDRLLVATAILHRAPFITRDRRILEHFESAVW